MQYLFPLFLPMRFPSFSNCDLTTINKLKSREVYTNDEIIITQNISNTAVPTSSETK